MSLTISCGTSGFEILNPINQAPPGSDVDRYLEGPTDTYLIQNQGFLEITFDTEKVSDDYQFDEKIIINTVDDPQLAITFQFYELTTTGFKVLFNALPDSGNYIFRWKVVIPT